MGCSPVSVCVLAPGEEVKGSSIPKQGGSPWGRIVCGTLDERDGKDECVASRRVSPMLSCCPARPGVVVGQILCMQRVFLTMRQTPFPAGCPAPSECPWLSPQHQPSKGRVDGEVGSRYPTGAASIGQGDVRSREMEVCRLWGQSHHQEKSKENRVWMVSPSSPAIKRVRCCRQDLAPLCCSSGRQRCGRGESWGPNGCAGAQGNQKGAEVQLRPDQFTHVPCAVMNGDVRYSW